MPNLWCGTADVGLGGREAEEEAWVSWALLAESDPGGGQLIVLINHFKSKLGGGTAATTNAAGRPPVPPTSIGA